MIIIVHRDNDLGANSYHFSTRQTSDGVIELTLNAYYRYTENNAPLSFIRGQKDESQFIYELHSSDIEVYEDVIQEAMDKVRKSILVDQYILEHWENSKFAQDSNPLVGIPSPLDTPLPS